MKFIQFCNTCLIQVATPEVASSLSAAVESQSVESSATVTPPIDSSTPPSPNQASAAPQAVQPDSVDYEVRYILLGLIDRLKFKLIIG